MARSKPLEEEDWSGIYTQFQQEHVLGTVPYRWESEQGYTEAVLVEVTFVSLDVLLFRGPLLHDGKVSGRDKAVSVKQHLGLNEGRPLLQQVGEDGQVALIEESEGEWELIIPHELLPKLQYQERIVARFRRHPTIAFTHRWRAEEKGDWCPWEEGSTPACIPDSDMSWCP